MSEKKDLLDSYKRLIESQQDMNRVLQSELKESHIRLNHLQDNLERFVDKYSNAQVLPTKVLVSDG